MDALTRCERQSFYGSRGYYVEHGGVGYGWFVTHGSRTVAGPYTSREQAEARAAEMASADSATLAVIRNTLA